MSHLHVDKIDYHSGFSSPLNYQHHQGCNAFRSSILWKCIYSLKEALQGNQNEQSKREQKNTSSMIGRHVPLEGVVISLHPAANCSRRNARPFRKGSLSTSDSSINFLSSKTRPMRAVFSLKHFSLHLGSTSNLFSSSHTCNFHVRYINALGVFVCVSVKVYVLWCLNFAMQQTYSFPTVLKSHVMILMSPYRQNFCRMIAAHCGNFGQSWQKAWQTFDMS